MKLFRACLNIICIFWSFACVYAAAPQQQAANANITIVAKTNNDNNNNSSSNNNNNNTNSQSHLVTGQAPIAEKLVRYRRQPPLTIIKHVIRSSSSSSKRAKPRRRVKRPKIRYGPPPSFTLSSSSSSSSSNYAYDDHLGYHKPPPPTSYETSAFSLDEFQNLNLNAADFELPPSSYEAQSMDLDFYSGHNGNNNDELDEYSSSYHQPKQPTIPTASADEFSNLDFEQHIEPTSYAQKPRKPHQKYGLPKTLDYTNGYQAPSPSPSPSYLPTNNYYSTSYNSYQADTDASYGGSFDDYKPETNASPPSHYNTNTDLSDDIFSTAGTYGPPRKPKPQYGAPSMDSYNIYDKKIPNAGYGNQAGHATYDETLPAAGPTQQNTDYSQFNYGQYGSTQSAPPPSPAKPANDIEFTYSPSYEINLLQPNQSNQPQYTDNHNQPQQQPGQFAEPPAPPVNTYNAPDNRTPPQQPPLPPQQQPGPIDDYVPPTQELPLNPHHKQPAYDFPKSSYEVPIYDPIPFDASTNDEQEYYPPNQYDEAAQPAHDIPQETRQRESNFPSNYQTHRPAFNNDAHASESDLSATSTTKLQRNRKRPTGQRKPLGSSTTKHTLDVPELKKAFEASKQNIAHPTRYADTEVNASTYIVEHQAFLPTQSGTSKDQFVSQTWNPIRIKAQTAQSASTSTTLTAPTAATATPQTRTKLQFRQRPRLSTTLRPVKVENNRYTSKPPAPAVSIQKSQSASYYDGTLAPPTLTITNQYNSRLNKFKTPTRHPPSQAALKPATATSINTPKQPSTQRPYKDAPTAKRTTKSIFVTTHFKTPQNEKAAIEADAGASSPYVYAQTLPKNHKFF